MNYQPYVIDHIAKHRKECCPDNAVRKEYMRAQGRLKRTPPTRVEITRRRVLGVESITPVWVRYPFLYIWKNLRWVRVIERNANDFISLNKSSLLMVRNNYLILHWRAYYLSRFCSDVRINSIDALPSSQIRAAIIFACLQYPGVYI